MKITAKIIKDSVNPAGERITTFVLHYPYWIHGELMTHRAFSRNAASTRAIPIKTYCQKVLDEMSIPLVWTQNEKGMYTDKIMPEEMREYLENNWRVNGERAVEAALYLEEHGLHKQVANRLLMPFMMMDTLVTATEYQNFFNLRDHPHAEPHIQILAREMKKAYAESVPQQLQWGEWHIPYEISFHKLEEKLMHSVACAARVSHANVDGSETTLEKDIATYTKLKDANPIHASPFEHCGKAFDKSEATQEAMKPYTLAVDAEKKIDEIYRSMGNFRGFQQLRWFVENNLPY